LLLEKRCTAERPSHLPRGARGHQRRMAPGAGCWQVFGLTSAPDESGFLLPIASQPSRLEIEAGVDQ